MSQQAEAEHDTEHTNDITCPHCGAEDGDSWEHSESDGDTIDCSSCDKPFVLSVNHSVTYSTKKVSCEDEVPEKAHQYGDEAKRYTVTQEDIERYKREGSCLADGKPRWFWIRTCEACGENDFSESAEPGGACVWKSEVAA